MSRVGDIVRLEWLDANSQRDQSTKVEVLAVPLPIVATYGVLLESTKTRVTVVGEELREDLHGDVQVSYRSTTVVPRGMVLKLRTLR